MTCCHDSIIINVVGSRSSGAVKKAWTWRRKRYDLAFLSVFRYASEAL